jgi:titin
MDLWKACDYDRPISKQQVQVTERAKMRTCKHNILQSSVVIAVLLISGWVHGENLTVTNLNDSGDGSLRWAIAQTNGNPGSDSIDFSVSGTTSPTSALPEITSDGTIIDASNAGVVLDGTVLSSGSGLVITSDSNLIKGIRILNFPSDGISITGGASHNVIVDNVVSGNNGMGISIYSAETDSNTVKGNFIGTDAAGTSALGNGVYSVNVTDGSRYNVIGGTNEDDRNVISGQNNSDGVWIGGAGTMYNVVIGNYIGTDVSGTMAIPNADDGVDLADGAMFNRIGGTTATERNVISGNIDEGIFLGGSVTYISSNTIKGNFIGVDASGTISLGNGKSVASGMYIYRLHAGEFRAACKLLVIR